MSDIANLKTIRTSEGLRDMLFDELDNLRSGNTSPQHSREICRVSNVIINSLMAEIQFHKVVVNGQERETAPTTVLRLGQSEEPSKMQAM